MFTMTYCYIGTTSNTRCVLQGVGFPGHIQVGVAIAGCIIYGFHGMAGLSYDENTFEVGW